jgi:hypothetical protein
MGLNAKKSQRKNNGNKRKKTALGKVRIEIQNGSSGMSPYGGLWPAVELFRQSGLPEAIDSCIGARSGRGYSDSDHVLALTLLNLAGGSAVDHLKDLKERLCFEKLGVSIPSPTSVRNWLKEFHNGEEDNKRGQGKAFVPGENSCLSGFRNVFSRLLSFSMVQNDNCGRLHGTKGRITLDQDATFIETESYGSLWNYEKSRSYQAFNTYCPEHDLILASGYRDGNVPSGYGQKEELERVLSSLPGEAEVVSLRSDCAGYQTDLLTYCNEGKSDRFGRISFGISCPMVKEFREAIRGVPEEEWKPLGNETIKLKDGTVRLAAEWAEVHYFPNSLSFKKHGPDYRFFAIRDPRDPTLHWHNGREEYCESQAYLIKEVEEALENKRCEEKKDERFMILGDCIYRTRGIVTNIDDGEDGSLYGYGEGEPMDGEKIIQWQRRRCGKSEEAHHILKDELAGGHVPSGRFGANAAWWNISALALNLHNLLKRLLLPCTYRKSRPKTLRFLLYAMVCKIVRHGRGTILKIWSGDRGCMLFAHAEKRLFELRCLLE